MIESIGCLCIKWIETLYESNVNRCKQRNFKMNVHLKAICVYIYLVFGTWSYLSFNQYKIIVLGNLTGSKCLSYILFMFTSNSTNDCDHISNESFPLPNAYNVILRIRLQEITQQSNIKTTAVREWESGVHNTLHCTVHHIPKPNSFRWVR